MAFKRITENDMLGKGNVGKPDTPGVSTSEMQRIMDELPREVIAPAFNELSGQLEANTASADIGANAPDGITPDPAPAENSPAKLQSVLQGIVNKITDHIADQVKHVTSEERTLWNNASNDRHTHDNKSILDGITSSLVGNWNAAFAHVSDAVRHITENERTNWNDKYTKSETDKAINERVVEIGSSDMTKAVYDPETRNLPYIPKIDAEALTLGKNVVLSGTPVSIAYAGANRIASITAYGENAQGGTTEAPVALTGISSVTVNDDVTELPIPRPLRRVGDVRDKCITRVKSVYDKRIVIDQNSDIKYSGEGSTIGTSRRFYIGFPSSELPQTIGTVIGNVRSNRLPAASSATTFSSDYEGVSIQNDSLASAIQFRVHGCKTLEEIKAWLADNPLIVYYQSTAYDGTNGLDVCLTEYMTGYIESYAGESITTTWISSTGALSTGAKVAYVLNSPETYATDPLDIDNAAGLLTVMTGGEVEVRMTELVGTRSDVSNNTVAFSEAAQDAEIQTGEKLSVLFGKIKKRFAVIASNLSNIYNKTESDERYATAAQGEKADNALPKTGGPISGNLTVVQDLTVQRAFNGMRIKAGVKVITTTDTTNRAELFTSDQLNTLFGTSGVTYDASNSVVVVANGDYAAQSKNITAGFVNSKWAIFSADGSNLLTGGLRVNYIAIKFA